MNIIHEKSNSNEGICHEKVSAAEQLQELPSSAVASPSVWNWRYFNAPNLPDCLSDTIKPIGASLTLADGQSFTGQSFKFPKDGIINLYDLLSPRPAVLAKTVLVADFITDKAGILTLAIGVDWMIAAGCNGQIFLDTRSSGNGEIPVGFDHICAVQCREGRNQLVLEVFGGAASFDVALKVLDYSPPALRYPPFAAFPDAESDAMSIIFTANCACPAGIDLRKKDTTKWQRIYDSLGGKIRRDRDVHTIRLYGLEPDTEYEYRVVLLDKRRGFAEQTEKDIHSFRSAPHRNRPFSFLATADIQIPFEGRTEFLTDLLTAPDAQGIDFFAFLGDILWASEFDKTVIDEFVMPFRNVTGNRLPLVMVRGNHEIYGKDSDRYFQYFSMPEPGREGYGMFRYGDVCFIVLDFCDDAMRGSYPSPRCLHDFEPYIASQHSWLEKALTLPMCSNALYRIVLAHGVPVGDFSEYMPNHVRKIIDPFFSGPDPKVKVHLWLGGHVHRPFRSIPGENAFCSILPPEKIIATQKFPYSGVNYHFPVVITGGPANSIPDNMKLTSIKVDVTHDALIVSARDRKGREFDRISITPDGNMSELNRAYFFKYYHF